MTQERTFEMNLLTPPACFTWAHAAEQFLSRRTCFPLGETRPADASQEHVQGALADDAHSGSLWGREVHLEERTSPQSTRAAQGDGAWLASLTALTPPLRKAGFPAGDLILIILAVFHSLQPAPA